MTWARLVELDCDNTPCWSGPFSSTTDDVPQARLDAARYSGWTYDEATDKDFCKKCTKIRQEDSDGVQHA